MTNNIMTPEEWFAEQTDYTTDLFDLDSVSAYASYVVSERLKESIKLPEKTLNGIRADSKYGSYYEGYHNGRIDAIDEVKRLNGLK